MANPNYLATLLFSALREDNYIGIKSVRNQLEWTDTSGLLLSLSLSHPQCDIDIERNNNEGPRITT